MRITAEIDGTPVISTTEVSSRLGVQVTSTLLKKIGVEPYAVLAHGTYWRESQMSDIRKALIEHILRGYER